MNSNTPMDPQKANEVAVLNFILGRVLVQQRLLAEVIAKVEGTTQAAVLERIDVLVKQSEMEAIHYLKKYWVPDDTSAVKGNGKE